MQTLLIASMALLATPALAAPPPGSCLGGCLPTAISAPTPVFPVGYQCKSGWPNYAPVSCVAPEMKESTWTLVEHYSKHGGTHIERQ